MINQEIISQFLIKGMTWPDTTSKPHCDILVVEEDAVSWKVTYDVGFILNTDDTRKVYPYIKSLTATISKQDVKLFLREKNLNLLV